MKQGTEFKVSVREADRKKVKTRFPTMNDKLDIEDGMYYQAYMLDKNCLFDKLLLEAILCAPKDTDVIVSPYVGLYNYVSYNGGNKHVCGLRQTTIEPKVYYRNDLVAFRHDFGIWLAIKHHDGKASAFL